MVQTRPYCLTIAGFDPSGGAGIVADCKTFDRLKTQGLSVMTCNTIQTEDQFSSFNWVDKDIILAQLEAILDRYPVKFIKIGLMENTSVLLDVLRLVQAKISQPIIVWDPVLKPSSGGEVEEKRFSAELKDILNLITVITPNKPEFEVLFGTQDALEISKNTNLTIFLKGGHSEEKGKDYLYHQGEMYPFRSKIQTTREKHGTGCMLSSALTAFLSRGFPMMKSCVKAKDFTAKRIISNDSLLAYY
jgi:hydroxymethylpyrimidine/phosphomethylpyrimidine kinase